MDPPSGGALHAGLDSQHRYTEGSACIITRAQFSAEGRTDDAVPEEGPMTSLNQMKDPCNSFFFVLLYALGLVCELGRG